MRFLRQNTAATVGIGPFPNPTTGLAVTGLTSQSGRTIKNGVGAALTPTSWTHDGGGHYLVGLASGDVDTLGRLRITFDSGASYLPTWEDFSVLSAAVYDVIFGTVAPSTLTAAAVAAAVAGRFGQAGTTTGTPAAGSFTASVSGSGLSSTTGFYVGSILKFDTGTANASVARKISGYTVSGDTATFTFTGTTGASDAPFPVAPAAGDAFLVLGRG